LRACNRGRLDTVLRFLKDERIEAKDVKEALSLIEYSGIGNNLDANFSALLDDERVNADDVNGALLATRDMVFS
jgi:hypothetical protein